MANMSYTAKVPSNNKKPVCKEEGAFKISKDETVIILDWDDTLFPTSFVSYNNIKLFDPEVRNRYLLYFSELDSIVYRLLKKLSEFGKILIVTNAMPVWVNVSSLVLPMTHTLLQNIKIVSARKNYQQKSSNMMDWKKFAFRDEIKNIMTDKNVMNIISVGDADYEYNALIDLYKFKQNSKLLKSVKFITDPSLETLIDQLEVMYNSVNDVCLTRDHLDLNFNFFSKNRIYN
jgi:hypothetical protein